ncbi:MAG: AmmeMemoRadiSam system radical SAM enzyme [Deltaproteobacteria bacterium]|nr:AmmeMemoRadiSam system radical SAM enzyme [Deltaproteobacteria bacterium]
MSRDVQCQLCPKRCVIPPGMAGDCRVRMNLDGKLTAVTYGHPVAVHVDPMEKKPLFHFLPGSPVFSVATTGCNLHCTHCQNWEISQAAPHEVPAYDLPPDEVVRLAQAKGCEAIAYTYTEPIVFYEYTYDTSAAARAAGLRNVLVTAGYINPGPFRRLCKVTDAAIIDLKAMSDAHYRQTCGATLAPVLDTLRIAVEEGVWVEVLNLIIPTLNDDPRLIEALVRFVREELGPQVPLHFTGFHPDYQLRNLPPTPTETLLRARQVGLEAGLEQVFVGNRRGGAAESSWCPGCGALLIERVGFRVLQRRLRVGEDGAGSCPDCGRAIAGVWA